MMQNHVAARIPGWVPDGALRYLVHTETGQSIRDLARVANCHASTISRQIRRVELRRDDPLVDGALSNLAAAHFPPGGSHSAGDQKPSQNRGMKSVMETGTSSTEDTPDAQTLDREAVRILRRLCETGAVLAVAETMEKAVVVRDGADGSSTRTAVVDRAIAEAMALKEWIACTTPGRVCRYHVTNAGRSALGYLLAEAENRARTAQETGFGEARAGFDHGSAGSGQGPDVGQGSGRRVRHVLSESPLLGLARRRDRDGQRFLSADLVRAGERLREDFELSQIGPTVTQNWDQFLTGGATGRGPSGFHSGPGDARERVGRALDELGPGLRDVALRCCCYLEGLETAEKQMGWSARSGKIVLRIALQRLRRYYDGLSAHEQMIG